MVEKPCAFDSSKECPVRKAFPTMPAMSLLEKACPICPIREQSMKPKGAFK